MALTPGGPGWWWYERPAPPGRPPARSFGACDVVEVRIEPDGLVRVLVDGVPVVEAVPRIVALDASKVGAATYQMWLADLIEGARHQAAEERWFSKRLRPQP